MEPSSLISDKIQRENTVRLTHESNKNFLTARISATKTKSSLLFQAATARSQASQPLRTVALATRLTPKLKAPIRRSHS